MGFFDSLTSFIPFSTPVDAEAADSSDNADTRGSVKGGARSSGQGEGSEEEDGDNKGASSGDDDEAEGDEADEPAEEEEEEEAEDNKPALEEGELLRPLVISMPVWRLQWLTTDSIECANSKQCKPHKTHYDECALRVDEQIEKFGNPKENCVEECMFYPHHVSSYKTSNAHYLQSSSLLTVLVHVPPPSCGKASNKSSRILPIPPIQPQISFGLELFTLDRSQNTCTK